MDESTTQWRETPQDVIDVVRGKQIVRLDGLAFRDQAAAYERVVVDLGAGDGRWAYRLARAHPAWFCVAVDANADGLREVSFRAGRKPGRGGTANAWCVRAAVEALPPALDGLADEIRVYFPWGSLLRAVLLPDVDLLRRIARMGRPGAAFHARVNASIFDDPHLATRLRLPSLGNESVKTKAVSYAAGGIRLETRSVIHDEAPTSWARRLTRGSVVRVLAFDGTIARKMGASEVR
jgi:16S rRNA (adenine(1408)-N(1))-methyltransferase